jgi:hypothetical protein
MVQQQALRDFAQAMATLTGTRTAEISGQKAGEDVKGAA